MHNSRNNSHRLEWLTFKRDRVKISLAFVFIVAFVTRDFYGKEKNRKNIHRFIVQYKFYILNKCQEYIS